MASDQRARLDGSGRRVAIVFSRFNEIITSRLVDGAVDSLLAHGVDEESIETHWVAGAFELPQLAARIARDGKADGVLALGAIIRGETIHFDVLAHAVASALERVGCDGEVPVAFGVITADTMDQASARAGGKHGNAGRNAAASLIEMMHLWRS